MTVIIITVIAPSKGSVNHSVLRGWMESRSLRKLCCDREGHHRPQAASTKASSLEGTGPPLDSSSPGPSTMTFSEWG